MKRPLVFLMTSILLTTIASAEVEMASLVRFYDDGKTQVMSPHLDLSATAFEDEVKFTFDYAMDDITSASSDVKSFATSDTIEDNRQEFGTGVAFTLDKGTFGLNYIQSDENDYHSKLVAMSASRDLFEKNTTIGLSFVYGDDLIESSSDSNFSNRMLNETFTLSLTQVMSQYDVFQFLIDLRVESGVLNSPYRSTRFQSDSEPDGVYRGKPENLPRTRNRQVYTMKWNHYLKGIKIAWANSFRFYTDSWGVLSGTLEERFTKVFGKLDLALSIRISHQEAAKFYKDIYPADTGPFHTGNKSLGTYDSYHLGLRPTFRFTDRFSVFAKTEYYIQNFANHTDIGEVGDSSDNKKLQIGALVIGAGLDVKF